MQNLTDDDFATRWQAAGETLRRCAAADQLGAVLAQTERLASAIEAADGARRDFERTANAAFGSRPTP